MHSGWTQEFWYALGLAVVALIAGLMAGYPLTFLCLGLLVYVGWHLFNIVRLQRSFTQEKSVQFPVSRGVWEDIFNELHRLQTRNRKRKRKLAHILKLFQEATAALPDATVVLNPRGEIEWFNEAAHALLGLHWPQDTGQYLTNLLRHPHLIAFLKAGDYTKTVEIPSPIDPNLLLSVLITPYGDEKRLLVARDITRIHRLEQVRRDFVANVSHELRTPLTVVNGFLETLNEASDECPKEWVRSLQLMKQQTERMQNIVKDLLMLSRLESEHAASSSKTVAVPEMLQAILKDARSLSAERSHELVLDTDLKLYLLGHHDELLSAFSNLIFNAVQYTPARGKIHIRWFRDASGAHLAVQDTGEGIALHHLPRLTERFYRADTGRSRQTGGTGLGLAIVKHVLNRHAAQLRIQSELGKGSTFTCDFPDSVIVQQH